MTSVHGVSTDTGAVGRRLQLDMWLQVQFSRARPQRRDIKPLSSYRPYYGQRRIISRRGSAFLVAAISDDATPAASTVSTTFVAETILPTSQGKFRLRGYRHSVRRIMVFSFALPWLIFFFFSFFLFLSSSSSSSSSFSFWLYDRLLLCICPVRSEYCVKRLLRRYRLRHSPIDDILFCWAAERWR